MTYRCVREIGRHIGIFSKSDNEYVIVDKRANQSFWDAFPLSEMAPPAGPEEEADLVSVLRTAREAGRAETPQENGADDRVIMVNNFVGGDVEPDFGIVCRFKAKVIESLREYMERQGGKISYAGACLLLVALHGQHDALLCNGKMIPFYSLDDIIVVDDIFVYVNPSKLLDVQRFRARVDLPYDRDDKGSFYAPEIWARRVIPYYITPQATLFSMAYMTAVCLFGDLPGDYDTDESQWKICLDQIYATKMYWCLLRCLYTAPRKRRFIII